MNKQDLDFFKQLVLDKLEQTSDDVESIENTARNNGRELASEDRSTYSLHMADHGTDAMEKEKSQLLVCGGEIGRARLEAVPTATQCISCKSKREQESDTE